ncbi:hypothetical protein LIER_38664 [Lithospermum erythrorhizon]|uniref:DUF6598 domain-containing protein n=1 Tax=Lithospermum erythrorhizon TaxID=34254 RepID=A0AAV3Q5R3_LITER
MVGVVWFSPQPLGRNDYKRKTSLPQITTKMVEEMETKQVFPTKEVDVMNIEGGILEREIEEMDTDGEDQSSTPDDDDDDESPVDDESEGGILDQKIEEMDTDGDDEYFDNDDDDGESPIDECGDVLSSGPNRCSWCLRSHKNKPWSSEAVEILSVFIGQEKSKAVQIYGSIEVLNGLDGSRVFDDCSSLEMKFDIKDVEGCLAIKGYVNWAATAFDSFKWYEKQLSSLIHCQHGGFVAIHYSIFEESVRVTIKVLLNLKTRSFDVNPKVWGSLVTQYSHYDYSSRYNKDYYRSVLFKRTQDDLVEISNDLTIPLSRFTIVVPSYSSLIVNVDLSFGISDLKLSCAKMIEIGEGSKTVETNDYLFRIELD